MSLSPVDYVDADRFPRDVREALNSLIEFYNATWEVKACESNSIQSARFEMSDGRVVLLLPRGVVSGGGEAYPFKVYFRNFGDGDSPEWKAGVEKESPTQETVDPTDLHYATGLLSDSPPKESSTGWLPTGAGDYIFEEVTFDSSNMDNPFTVLTRTIKSTVSGSTIIWPVQYLKSGSDPSATYAEVTLRIPIAKVQTDTNDRPYAKVIYGGDVIRFIAVQAVTAKDSADANPVDISGLMYTK